MPQIVARRDDHAPHSRTTVLLGLCPVVGRSIMELDDGVRPTHRSAAQLSACSGRVFESATCVGLSHACSDQGTRRPASSRSLKTYSGDGVNGDRSCMCCTGAPEAVNMLGASARAKFDPSVLTDYPFFFRSGHVL